LAFHRRDLQEIAEQVSGRILHKGLLRDDRLTYLNLTIALLDDYAGRGPTPLLQCFLSIISTSGLSRLNNSNCSSGSVASLSGGFAIVDDKKAGFLDPAFLWLLLCATTSYYPSSRNFPCVDFFYIFM